MSVSSRRNIDYAFPPLAPGLPSVYERAGFNVNKGQGRDNGSDYSRSGSPSIRSGNHSNYKVKSSASSPSVRSSQGDRFYRPTQTSSLARDASEQSASTPILHGAQDRSQLSFSSQNLDSRSLSGPRSASPLDKTGQAKTFFGNQRVHSNETLESPSRQLSNLSTSSDGSNLSGSSTSRTTRSSSSSNGLDMGHKMYLTRLGSQQTIPQHHETGNDVEALPRLKTNGIPQSQSLEFTDELRGPQNSQSSLHHQLAMDRYKEHGHSVSSLAYPAESSEQKFSKSQESFNFSTDNNDLRNKPTSPVVAVSDSTNPITYTVQAPLSPSPHTSSPYPGYRGRFSGQGRSIWAPDSSLGAGATLGDNSREFNYDESLPPPTNIAMENTNRFSTTSSIYFPECYDETLDSVQECDEDQELGSEEHSKRLSSTPIVNTKTAQKDLDNHRSASLSGASRKSSHSKECRGCLEVITGKSIHSKDGKLTGRWHRQCFRCIECADDLTGEVFVLDDQPYCQMCYHQANQTLCVNCEEGIEGDCLESYTEDGEDIKCRRYHPDCLVCHTCSLPLRAEFYEFDNKTFCNKHGTHKAKTHANVERRMTRMLLI